MRLVELVVSIDTECDKGPAWKTLRPLSFDSILRGIPEKLSPLFIKYGVRPTYLISPEVLREPQCVEILAGLRDTELGTHLHGEFIGPEDDLQAPVTDRPQATYRSKVEREKLHNLTALFERAVGSRPESFRGGRFSLSRHTLRFLSELGYKVDSTVTPFRTNRYATGRPAKYWGAPLQPYHPAKTDPRQSGGLPILEVPVSILAPMFARWPGFLLRLLSDRLAGQLARVAGRGKRLEQFWVRPLRGQTAELLSWSDTIIDTWAAPDPALINLMFHSNECWVGTSPYTQHARQVEAFMESLEGLLKHLVGTRKAVPVTLRECASRHRGNPA